MPREDVSKEIIDGHKQRQVKKQLHTQTQMGRVEQWKNNGTQFVRVKDNPDLADIFNQIVLAVDSGMPAMEACNAINKIIIDWRGGLTP